MLTMSQSIIKSQQDYAVVNVKQDFIDVNVPVSATLTLVVFLQPLLTSS